MMNCGYYLYSDIARRALAALEAGLKEVEISLDLHRSSRLCPLENEELVLDDVTRLCREDLRAILRKEGRIFHVHEGTIHPLEHRGEGGYYKLVPTDKAPLLEISGVKMHIAKGIDPFESAGRMAAQVVRKGHFVLDTCGGLGYAASAALKLGAKVVSVELSATVMTLREHNPWSRAIYEGENIRLVHADVNNFIKELEAETFDSIIHDPPRFSLAGELYGENFYREMYRVLKRRGGLFHYTGNPGLVRRGSSFADHAARRLKEAGFTRVVKISELMGVAAYK